MYFFNTKKSKYNKLVIRLKTLINSKDQMPNVVWSMLTELGEESTNYEELRVAQNLRDLVYDRMMSQAYTI